MSKSPRVRSGRRSKNSSAPKRRIPVSTPRNCSSQSQLLANSTFRCHCPYLHGRGSRHWGEGSSSRLDLFSTIPGVLWRRKLGLCRSLARIPKCHYFHFTCQRVGFGWGLRVGNEMCALCWIHGHVWFEPISFEFVLWWLLDIILFFFSLHHLLL